MSLALDRSAGESNLAACELFPEPLLAGRPNPCDRGAPKRPPSEAALLHFIDIFVPAFLAFIDDRVIPATHRGSDRLDCHDPGRIAVGAILKPYGLHPVRQLGRRLNAEVV